MSINASFIGSGFLALKDTNNNAYQAGSAPGRQAGHAGYNQEANGRQEGSGNGG